MPAGDGTGPMWGGVRAQWGGGGWCRGAWARAGLGLGGHGWRHGYHATGLPGRVRRGHWGEPWPFDGPDVGAERRDLEWRTARLEAELRWIRSRLDELRSHAAVTE